LQKEQVRAHLEIKNIRFVLSVLGLVILLLLSPCKVRNAVEAELGVPQTNVLNKSQATLSQAACQTVEISETIQAISKTTVRLPFFPMLRTDKIEDAICFPKHAATKKPSGAQQPVSDIPLYILHQNILVYS
jgi:hypothetical protein